MKTKRLLMVTILFLIIYNLYGQTKSYFPSLTRISVDTTYKVFFGYDKSTTHLINKHCYELDKSNPLHCYEDSIFDHLKVIAKFKNKALKDSIYIIYSEGPSADPLFEVYTNAVARKVIGRFFCLEFYINSSGTIYTSGHTNSMFNKRRKFQIENDTITEVQQPYLYVGMKGKTMKELTLFKEKTGKDIVAQLPKNYEIEVLLAEPSADEFNLLYLVRTHFGLVGWLRLENLFDHVIKDLYYTGD